MDNNIQNEVFCPRPDHPEMVLQMWRVLECMKLPIPDWQKCLRFFSMPYTTGPRYVALRREQGEAWQTLSPDEKRQMKRTQVVEPNIASALEALRDLVERYDRDLWMHPAYFDCPEFTQTDYYVFWGHIVAMARVVYFHDGWEFSTGCIYEFYRAAEAGCEIRDAHNRPLAFPTGVGMIACARAEMQHAGIDTHFVDAVFEHLVALKRG